MTWHSPAVLWLVGLLPLLALALWHGWRLRRRASHQLAQLQEGAAVSASAAAPRMVRGRSAKLRAARGALFLLGTALTIVALARPQYGSRSELLRKRGLDVVVAIDFSKSMLARDVRPSRFERAIAEVQRFLSELAGDRVGLVAFAGETMQFPMTSDYAAATLFLRDLTPNDLPVGGTAIGRALVAAQRLLERSATQADSASQAERARVVVLLTDGEDHEGEPLEAARALAERGIRLYTVGIGSRTGEPIPTYASDGTWTGYLRDDDGQTVLTSLTAENEAQLRQLAELTGGKYFRAERGSVGMDAVRAEMQHMKRTELQARRITVHEDRFVLALLPAFLLLLLEALLPEARLREPAATRRRRRETSSVERGGGPVAAGMAILLFALSIPGSAQAWQPLRSRNRDIEQGNLHLSEGRPKEALEAYERAARALPNEAGVHLNRGLAWLTAGDAAQAREALRLAATGEAEPELRAQAFYNLGLSFYQEGDALAGDAQHQAAQARFREAVESFIQSLRLLPGNRDAAWNLELARRRIEQEKQREQEQQQEQEQEQDPDDSSQNQDSSQDEDPSDRQPDPDGEPQRDEGAQDESGEASGDEESQPEQSADSPAEPDEDSKEPAPRNDPAQDDRSRDDPGQESSPSDDGAHESAQPVLPRDVERALDALQAAEQSLEQIRARQRAGSRPTPAKDW